MGVGVGPGQRFSLTFLGYFTLTSSFLHRFTSNWYWTSLMTIRSISTMHGPIANPGAPRPHRCRPHPPKIAFYYNFFISTRIHFKLILNLSYDNTVNLNYAWPHYQPWGRPAHIDHTHPKLPFTIISSFLHRFTSNWYAWPHYQPWGEPLLWQYGHLMTISQLCMAPLPTLGRPAHIDHTHPKLPFTIISSFLHRFTSNWYWTSLMTIRSISTMHGPITNPGAPCPHRSHPPKIAFYYNFFISTPIHF